MFQVPGLRSSVTVGTVQDGTEKHCGRYWVPGKNGDATGVVSLCSKSMRVFTSKFLHLFFQLPGAHFSCIFEPMVMKPYQHPQRMWLHKPQLPTNWKVPLVALLDFLLILFKAIVEGNKREKIVAIFWQNYLVTIGPFLS